MWLDEEGVWFNDEVVALNCGRDKVQDVSFDLSFFPSLLGQVSGSFPHCGGRREAHPGPALRPGADQNRECRTEGKVGGAEGCGRGEGGAV